MAYYASPPRSPYTSHPVYSASSTVSSLSSTMSAPSPPPAGAPVYSPPKFRTFQERKREKERALIEQVGGHVAQPRYTTQPAQAQNMSPSPSTPVMAHSAFDPASQFPLHHRQSLQSIPLHLLAQNGAQSPSKPTPPPRRRESIDVLNQGWRTASSAPDSPRRPLPSPGQPGSPIAAASPGPRRALPRPGSISSIPLQPLPDSPSDSPRTRTASLPLGTATPSVMPYPYNTLHGSQRDLASAGPATDMGPALPSSPTTARAATLPMHAYRDPAMSFAADQATLRRGQSETTGRSGRRPLPKPSGNGLVGMAPLAGEPTAGVGRRQSMPLFKLSGIAESQPAAAAPVAPAGSIVPPSISAPPALPNVVPSIVLSSEDTIAAAPPVPTIVFPGETAAPVEQSEVLPKRGNKTAGRRVPSVTITSIPVIAFPDEDEGGGSSLERSTPPARVPSPSFSFSAAPSIQVSSDDTPSIVVPNIHLPSESGPSIPTFSFPDEEPAVPVGTQSAPPATAQGGLFCGACDTPIIGRIVSAMNKRWHPDCFKCETCKMPLEHVSSYEHEGKAYCHMDYHDQFAPKCHHCATAIVDSRFVTINDAALGQRYYHELHFFCAECGDPFLEPSKSSAAGTEVLRSGAEPEEDQTKEFVIHGKYAFCEECHVKLHKPKCKGCKKPIRDVAVAALGMKWHKECFRCSQCDGPFPHDNFFPIDGKALCQDCYTSTL